MLRMMNNCKLEFWNPNAIKCHFMYLFSQRLTESQFCHRMFIWLDVAIHRWTSAESNDVGKMITQTFLRVLTFYGDLDLISYGSHMHVSSSFAFWWTKIQFPFYTKDEATMTRPEKLWGEQRMTQFFISQSTKDVMKNRIQLFFMISCTCVNIVIECWVTWFN